jgi:hypothetical protein
MRAQTVNFEKGIEPKEAMGIGIKPFEVEEVYIAGVKINDDKWLNNFLKKDLPLFIKFIEDSHSSGLSFKEKAEDETQKMLYSIFRQGYDGIYYKGKYYPFKPRTFESLDFERGIDPKESIGIGNEGFRIYNKFQKIAKSLGIEEAGINDLNQKIAIGSWKMPWLKGDVDKSGFGRIILFQSVEDSGEYKVYSKGKRGSDIQDWRMWNSPRKWLENIKMLNESINFERGIDPKKSMGIGEEATYQKIADMMQKDGWSPVDPYESDSAIGWAVEYGHHDLAKFLLDRHSHQDEVQNQMVNYIQWSAQNRNLDMLELLLSYFNLDPSHLNFALRMASSYEPAYNTIKSYMNKTNESLEFERGKDPKSSLNIGLSRYSLENQSFPMINDEIIKTAISEIMELPPEKIYFMGDTRGEEIDYLNRLADYVYSLDRIDNLEIETGEWIGTLELYDLDEGKICVFEDHAHAEFFGDIIAFEKMKTREHLIV